MLGRPLNQIRSVYNGNNLIIRRNITVAQSTTTGSELPNSISVPDGSSEGRASPQTKHNIEAVIGLEVHAQLTIRSKLFSQGLNDRTASSNSTLDLLDIALPGSLPKLNRSAIMTAIRTGLGLNCSIQEKIHFDRKNYFYTDMPAGYQITQYHKPIAKDGYIDFIVTDQNKLFLQNYPHTLHYDKARHLFYDEWENEANFKPYIKCSRIRQIQLEQDSAKTLNQIAPDDTELSSLVDYNRSGVALVEIVFDPDLSRPNEATSLVRELVLILKSLGACDCKLREGTLRVDANISIKSIDGSIIPDTHNNRVELKNLNSMRALYSGISYEIERQAGRILSGNPVIQESRFFELKTGRSRVLRLKETATDYRYVPEPNIPPLRIERSLIDMIKNELNETVMLPDKLRDRLQREYNLDLARIADLLDFPGLAEYFMAIIDIDRSFDQNLVADFLFYAVSNLNIIKNLPMQVDLTDRESEFMRKLTPNKVNQLLRMAFDDEISFAIAYEVMKCLYTSDNESCPRQLVESFGWFQINDDAEVSRICSLVIRDMKAMAKRYKKRGERKVLGYMLDKLNELYDNRVSTPKAIDCLNSLLRPQEIINKSEDDRRG